MNSSVLNLYDAITVNIDQAHKAINSSDSYSNHEHYLGFTHKLLYDKGIYHKLIDAGLIRGWFEEFSEYWNRALNGRPLKFHDFFYLYSHYRTNFQYVAVTENSNKNEYLNAWQRHENIYLTFGSCYKYALDPFSGLPFLKYLKDKDSILEYGCGLAPITTSLLKCKKKMYKFTLADIRSFTYHYSKYRLKQHNVRFIDVIPYELPALEDRYDTIFLMTVLEHLPDPEKVIRLLTEHLKVPGYLIFDYALGEGRGLDTMESVKQRQSVLDFVNSKYYIVSGQIKYDQSMGTTILQKISS